jgi:preprotein translocase subunit SecA
MSPFSAAFAVVAAAPSVAWRARERSGVHIMTVNDFHARCDALWMGEIYRTLGFSIS